MKMNLDKIKEILPHRDPMLLVSTVEALTPGEEIETTFYVNPSMAIFDGHFPDEPVLPGVYTVECMAQTADILLMTVDCYAGKKPLFLGINHVRFMKKILPGSTIKIYAKKISERPEKAIATCAATVYCGEDAVAQGEVTLAMR